MTAGERTLFLFRHAKSRWDENGKSDFERSLAPRGVKAAGRMGRWLQAKGRLPERVLCSSAVRARETWRLASLELTTAPACEMVDELYMATPRRMLTLIAAQAEEIRALMLIGHNPGLHSLALQLLGDGAPAALSTNLPTAGLVVLRLSGADWTDIAGIELIDYIIPRQLPEQD